jgi:Porin PorA
MRRVTGLVLAGVGTFLIVCAVALPTVVSSQVIKFPLNEYETATLAASNASYFSAKTLTERTGVNMEATYTIKGDASKGDSATAVWNEYAYVYDRTNHEVVQQMTRTFAFDRKTGQLVNCCGASVNGDSSVQQRGYVGYVFPIGTKKQTYNVFDTTLNQPVPFTYAGTATVHGVHTYKFVENVAPRQITTQAMPGSLVGMSAATVTLPEFYEIHLIYYVDPVTGALVNVNEHQTLSLRNPSTGAQALLLFDANLIATPSSVNTIVGLDNDGRNKLNLIETTLPIVLGIVGAIGLIAGYLLARKRRPTMEDELDAMSRKLAATSADRPASPRHAASSPHPATQPATQEHAAAPAPRAGDTAKLAGVVPGMEADPPEATAQPAEAEDPDTAGPKPR